MQRDYALTMWQPFIITCMLAIYTSMMPTTFGTCDKFDAQVDCNGGTLVLAMTS
jgi:hypothetical protein